MDGELELLCILVEVVVEGRTYRVSAAYVAYLSPIVECVGPVLRPVYELIGEDEVPRLIVLPEAPDSA